MARAKRPIFVPVLTGPLFVEEKVIEFEWFPGFAATQWQKSIASLHKAGVQRGISPILEISSKSTESSGVKLSALNLRLLSPDGKDITVECAFQGSKVFTKDGPFTDLYYRTSRDAKTDERLRNSGDVIGFRYFDQDFPTQPTTAFYDWLYLHGLANNPELASRLCAYRGFTDIRFNPTKSLNCQAHSAALYVALEHRGQLEKALSDQEAFFKEIAPQVNHKKTGDQKLAQQGKIF